MCSGYLTSLPKTKIASSQLLEINNLAIAALATEASRPFQLPGDIGSPRRSEDTFITDYDYSSTKDHSTCQRVKLMQDNFGEEDTESTNTEEMDRIRDEIRSSDPELIIANHCYGLFELAAIHLTSNPPNLLASAMAIDALGAIVAALDDRLTTTKNDLSDALAQIRLAFVQLSSIAETPMEDND